MIHNIDNLVCDYLCIVMEYDIIELWYLNSQAYIALSLIIIGVFKTVQINPAPVYSMQSMDMCVCYNLLLLLSSLSQVNIRMH